MAFVPDFKNYPNLAGMYSTLPTNLSALQATLANAPKPTANDLTMPSTPNLTTIDPGERPEMDDYNWYTQFIEKNALKPLSQEEQDRRARGASASAAVGALGNALSAFSNLTFTGGVAPSQVIPEAYNPTKDIENMRNREQNRADRYAGLMMNARQADTRDYLNAYNKWAQAIQANNGNMLQQYNINMDKYKFGKNEEWKDKEFGFKKEQADITNKRADKQLDYNIRHGNASLGLQRERLNMEKKNREEDRKTRLAIAAMKGSGSGSGGISGEDFVIPSYVPAGDGTWKLGHISINPGRLNTEDLGYVYDALPDDIKNQVDMELIDAKSDPKKTADVIRRALGRVANNEEASREMYEVLNGVGIISGNTNDDTAPWLRGSSDNNTAPWVK